MINTTNLRVYYRHYLRRRYASFLLRIVKDDVLSFKPNQSNVIGHVFI